MQGIFKAISMRRLLTLLLLAASAWCSAQTIQEVREEIRRQGLPHGDIVLAQARLETGNFTSRRCRVDNNIFGIKHGGRYARYARWQDSVTDYKRRVSSRYRSDEDYYSFLRRIKYAADGRYISKLKQF